MTTVIEELVIAIGHEHDKSGLDAAEKQGVESAEKVEGRWKKASEHIRTGINAAGKAIGVALGAAAGAAAAFTKKILDDGKELDTWRKKLDASAEDLGRVEQGFSSLNIEQDNTREALKTLRENLGELERLGTGPARDSLGSLGLTLKDLQDLSLEEQLGVLSDALLGVDDHAQRLSIAIELMGEDGAALLPALGLGSKGIRDLGDAAEASGRVMSDHLVDTTVEVNKKLDALKGELTGVALDLAESLIPAVEDGVDGLIDFKDANQEFIKEDIPTAIRAIGDAFLSVAQAIATASKEAKQFATELADFEDRRKLEEGRGDRGSFIADFLTFGISGEAHARATGTNVSAESAAASQNRVAFRGVLTPERQAQEIAASKAGQQALRGAQDVAAISEADVANRRAQAFAQTAFDRRGRGNKFNAAERAAASGAGGGKSAEEREKERQAKEAAARSEELFGEMFRSLAEQSGAGAIAVQASLEAAARQIQEGAIGGVAQEAGLKRLGGLTGKDFLKQRSGLLDEFGVQAILPGVTQSGPQVQITETTNNYTFDQKFNVPPGDVREVARYVAAETRNSWRSEVEGTIRQTDVEYAR